MRMAASVASVISMPRWLPSGSNDLIVIDVADHHTRDAGRLDELDRLDVIRQHITG